MDWEAIAEAVKRRRAELGYKRQEDAASAGEIGVTAWRDIEGAKQDHYRPTTLRGVEIALRWPAGMIHEIGRGGPPASTLEAMHQRLERIERLVARLADRVGLEDE